MILHKRKYPYNYTNNFYQTQIFFVNKTSGNPCGYGPGLQSHPSIPWKQRFLRFWILAIYISALVGVEDGGSGVPDLVPDPQVGAGEEVEEEEGPGRPHREGRAQEAGSQSRASVKECGLDAEQMIYVFDQIFQTLIRNLDSILHYKIMSDLHILWLKIGITQIVFEPFTVINIKYHEYLASSVSGESTVKF